MCIWFLFSNNRKAFCVQKNVNISFITRFVCSALNSTRSFDVTIIIYVIESGFSFKKKSNHWNIYKVKSYLTGEL